MRTLPRPCLGCGATVRGKPRCQDCQRLADRAKAARRPDLHNDARERERRRRTVADHRSLLGDWCPGWTGQPAHPAADLTADHVREVAAGGRSDGRLVVRCRSCNAARSAHLARRALAKLVADATDSPISAGQTTPRQPNGRLHTATTTQGPVVA
jgi:5-methylcytosine-specific restriction enzyme A